MYSSGAVCDLTVVLYGTHLSSATRYASPGGAAVRSLLQGGGTGSRNGCVCSWPYSQKRFVGMHVRYSWFAYVAVRVWLQVG